MDKKDLPFNPIDTYIATFPKDVQVSLNALRATIRATAPDAEETISYQMPTYRLKGNLVHFAAHKNHIGFYPTPSGIAAFRDELSAYKGAKGSVQFPLDQPLPLDLVQRIVRFRVEENLAAAAAKSSKRKGCLFRFFIDQNLVRAHLDTEMAAILDLRGGVGCQRLFSGVAIGHNRNSNSISSRSGFPPNPVSGISGFSLRDSSKALW